MKPVTKRILALVLMLALLVPVLLVPGTAAESTTRLYGTDRYATAFQAADALKEVLGINTFDTIVVASGTGFADALSGSYLAAVKNAPILLVSDNRIPQVRDYIDRNLSPNGLVYLLGGTSAVSAKVEDSLSGHNVKRLWGATRYATNLAILRESGLGDGELLICTGTDFADSLSASAVGKPIMLVGGSLTEDQLAMLESVWKCVIIGGTNAVSPKVENTLRDLRYTERLGGSTRYDTSVMVADYFFEKPAQAVLAYARNFPDGLCGGPLAYALRAPLLLTMTGQEAAANYHVYTKGISGGYVLGGPGLISDKAVNTIFGAKPASRKETPYVFPSGDYITTKDTTVDTGTMVYHLGENVFVPGHLDKVSDALTKAMEAGSGLTVAGNRYAQNVHPDDKLHVNSSRDLLYAGQDWYEGSDFSELGSAWAENYSHAHVSPGDLCLYDNYAIVHESAHVLRFKQSGWSFHQPIEEGFAEFTTYQTLKELEKTDPGAAFYLGRSCATTWNMAITDYDALYAQPVEYWFENPFEYSGNPNYCVGFRFMWYLQEVYGSYSKWLTAYEAAYPYRNASGSEYEASTASVVEIMKKTYGADVLDNFYPWLKKNEAIFKPLWDVTYVDMRAVRAVNLYPEFNASSSYAQLHRMDYRDLYVNLESLRTYVEDYKQLDASGLMLHNPGRITINLYRADGSYTTVYGETEISLAGISYIKLVGSGRLSQLQVRGYDNSHSPEM